jgi:glycosyltransferase involved in cell wall biosynthesis
LPSASTASSVPRRSVRVTFTGFEPFWMQVLVDLLSKRFADLDCRWVRWPSTLRERREFLAAMLTTDVAVRVGMPFEFESETNRFWVTLVRTLPRLKGVNYWIGSDVEAYRRRREQGQVGRADLQAVRSLAHFAAAANLEPELQGAGIPARTVTLPSPEREVPPMRPLPDQFSVLSYWGDGRYAFYGGPALFEAARALPDVPFRIVGTRGVDSPNPPDNVQFLGRVDDMERWYAASSVLVRLPSHDSVPAGMVEEALLAGRAVIYSFVWPHTVLVDRENPAALAAVLRGLKSRDGEGRLELNVAGREFTLVDWDPDVRATALREALLRVHEGSWEPLV